MQDLLNSTAGSQQLDRLVRKRLLCAFDFDGTLAPIVSKPEAARLPAHIKTELLELQRFAPVAIITGRALDDIRPRLEFEPDFLIGNHGIEGLPGADSAAAAERHLSVCAAWRKQLETLLAAEYPDPGVQVEDKRFSLSVHFRHAQAAERAQADLQPLLMSLKPTPRVVGGKCVFNLMPEDSGNKGTGMVTLIEETGASGAIYVGDDVTDEDVFNVQRDDLLSVRVQELSTSAADFFVPDLDDMPLLLQSLTKRLAAQGARNWLA